MALGDPARAFERPDPWITTMVKIGLLTTDGVDGTAVRVDTTNGIVTLYGTVGSEAGLLQAESAARRVEGVRGVRNLVEVVPEAHRAVVEASDAEIGARIDEQLRREPSLADGDVQVRSVADGTVLLSGEAASLADHERALELARAVPGVKRVASEIRSPDGLSDTELWYAEEEPGADTGLARDLYITTAAKLRLMAEPTIPALEINVDTQDGVVTLFGIVPDAAAKLAAEDAVRRTRWVRAVSNKLEVVPAVEQEIVKSGDAEIAASVERAVGRLDGADVDVEVSNRVVRLTGTVLNQTDRMAVLTIAQLADGVRAVEDELQVMSPTPAVGSGPGR
jgi:osmotically-inducible protein OsmY